MVFKKIWGSKFWIFEILDILKKPSHYNFDIQGKMKKMPTRICHNLLRMIKMNFFRKFKIVHPLIFGPHKFYKYG